MCVLKHLCLYELYGFTQGEMITENCVLHCSFVAVLWCGLHIYMCCHLVYPARSSFSLHTPRKIAPLCVSMILKQFSDASECCYLPLVAIILPIVSLRGQLIK